MMHSLSRPAHDLDEILAVDPGGTLFVDLERGAVEVRSHDANQVRVQARAPGWAAWSFEFDLALEDNDVHLTGESFSWGFWPFGGIHVTVRAWVPREYSVDVRTRGGRIELAELRGRIFAETSGGPVNLRQASGLIALRTSGGPIEAEGVDGDLRADTSGGAVAVSAVTGEVQVSTSGGSIRIVRAGGPVRARTSGGRIEVEQASSHVDAVTSGGGIRVVFAGEPAGNLETSGGNVEVLMPRDAGAQIEAETTGGRVEVDPALGVRGEVGPRRISGEINGGGPPLRLHTSGGNIRLRVG
jgi:hypothetical protein